MNKTLWNNKITPILILIGIGLCLFIIRSQWYLLVPKSLFPKVLASKTFGNFSDDYARHIIKTNDGGFLVVGETVSAHNTIHETQIRDAWVMKLDAKFNPLWQKTIGGSADDEIKTVFETKDGNFAIVGSTQSKDKDLPYNHGDFDYWFVKIDSQGKILWQKCFGGSLEDRAFDAIQVKSGGYLIVGYTYSDDGDVKEKFIGKDVWLVRIDEDGQLLWQRKLGGIDNEANKVIQTGDEGFLMVGYTPGAKSILDDDGASEHDALVVKFSKFGKIEWLKNIGGSDEDQATSVIETSKHEYMIAGWTRSKDGNVKLNHGSADYWAVKLNRQGKLMWSKTYGGSRSDQAVSIIETHNNQYLIAGETHSNDGNVKGNHGGLDAWVIKISSGGRLISQNCFGGSHDDVPSYIMKTREGEYILTAWTNSTNGDIQVNQGKNDNWVLKFSD